MNIREFLKSKKALTKFKNNYEGFKKWVSIIQAQKFDDPQFERKLNMSAERYLRECDNPQIISQSFIWIYAPELVSYWGELDSEYYQHCMQ